MATPFNEVSQVKKTRQSNRFSVFLADSPLQRRQCYKLRHDVFANEMGAEVRGTEPGIDKDRFDDACRHLAVYDNHTNELIATTRLLDNQGRRETGMFYSETEFDLGNIVSDGCQFMEVGRTCIHPEYRRGAAFVARHYRCYGRGLRAWWLTSGSTISSVAPVFHFLPGTSTSRH